MDNETVINIVINKVIEALGSSRFNNNVQNQVRHQSLEEIALREKYAVQATTYVVKDYTVPSGTTFADIAKNNSEAVEQMMSETKVKGKRKV